MFSRLFSILVCVPLMTTSCAVLPPDNWDPLSVKKAPGPPLPANKPLLGAGGGTEPAPCLPGHKPNIEEIGKGINECTPDRVTHFGGGPERHPTPPVLKYRKPQVAP